MANKLSEFCKLLRSEAKKQARKEGTLIEKQDRWLAANIIEYFGDQISLLVKHKNDVETFNSIINSLETLDNLQKQKQKRNKASILKSFMVSEYDNMPSVYVETTLGETMYLVIPQNKVKELIERVSEALREIYEEN